MRAVELFITGGLLYAALGLAFAVAWATVGAPHTDPAARGSGWAFRLLIVPGAALLWPLLAWAWFGPRPTPVRPASPAPPRPPKTRPVLSGDVDTEAETTG